jgi:alcohol dehydrogenase YqhD (iron-dependent ADH family)
MRLVINFTLHTPTRIIFGKGEVNRTGEIVKEYAEKVLLVTGRSSTKKTGSLDKVTKSLQEAGVDFVVFDQIEPNPRAETVDRGGKAAREEKCDLILALGGGSAMDAAKAIAIVAGLGKTYTRIYQGESNRPVERIAAGSGGAPRDYNPHVSRNGFGSQFQRGDHELGNEGKVGYLRPCIVPARRYS